MSPSNMHHHHSASLDDLLIEEQPAWLDELLREPASPKMNKGHRRSASDTAAYLNSTFMPFKEDDLMQRHAHGPSWRFQNINRHDDMWQLSNTNGPNIQRHMSLGAVNIAGSTSASKSAEKQGSKMKEGVSTKPDGSGSKTDSKRIKQ